VWLLLIVTCCEISISLTYFALCSEDYKWWWRSALVPAASGVYLYAYCVYYFFANLNMEGHVPQMLYFGACRRSRAHAAYLQRRPCAHT